MADNGCTQFLVSWHVYGQDTHQLSLCETWEGYSTPADFAKMLSIRHCPNGLADAGLIVVDRFHKVGTE